MLGSLGSLYPRRQPLSAVTRNKRRLESPRRGAGASEACMGSILVVFGAHAFISGC